MSPRTGTDINHIKSIMVVMRQLKGLTTARAILVCEDANIALTMALQSGMTVARAVELMELEYRDEPPD